MTRRYFQHIMMISFKNDVKKYFSKAIFLQVRKVKEFMKGIESKKYNFFQKIKIDI